MALAPPITVPEDTPSEVVRLSRLELNKVLVALESLATEIEDAASFGDAQTAIGATVQPLIEALNKILVRSERPAAPR